MPENTGECKVNENFEEWKLLNLTMRQWAILLAWYRRTVKQPDLTTMNGIMACKLAWDKQFDHSPGSIKFIGVEPETDFVGAHDAMLNFTHFVLRT